MKPDDAIAATRDGSPVRRFYVADPPRGAALVLRDDLAHRLVRVLRLAPGTAIELFDGSGATWTATIATVRPGAVSLDIGERSVRPVEPPTAVAAALIRPSRYEWLVEKATELGATELRPLVTARSAVRPAEIGAARLERWRRIAVEAAEQCGRSTLPSIGPPLSWPDLLRDLTGPAYVAAEPSHGVAAPLGTVVAGIGANPVTVITGPEGGLTADEIARATAIGVQPVSLGPLVLRAETAAIAALAILADARGR